MRTCCAVGFDAFPLNFIPPEYRYLWVMRFCSLILAVIVMWFSVLPHKVDLSSQANNTDEAKCEGACCENSGQNKKSDNDCCDKGVCNPFQVCNCCHFIFSGPILYACEGAFSLADKHHSKITDFFTSSFSADCFRPPELSHI